MGQLHNELHDGKLSAALTRAVNDTKGSGGLERYGETLTPTIDLWSQPEWAYLRTERLCAYARFVAAGGGGTTSGIALANPATTSLIVVVEKVTVRAAGTAQMYMAADSTADLGNSSQGTARDNRPNGIVRVSEAVVRYSNTPVGVPANHDLLEQMIAVATTFTPMVALPVILPPGRMLAVYNITTAIDLTVNFVWRERRAISEISGG